MVGTCCNFCQLRNNNDTNNLIYLLSYLKPKIKENSVYSFTYAYVEKILNYISFEQKYIRDVYLFSFILGAMVHFTAHRFTIYRATKELSNREVTQKAGTKTYHQINHKRISVNIYHSILPHLFSESPRVKSKFVFNNNTHYWILI